MLFEYWEISEDEFLDGIEIQGDMTSLSRPDNLTAETPFYASTHEGGSVVRVILGHGSNWAGVANPRFTIHHISRGHLINCAESTLQADGSLPVKCPWETWGKGPHTRLLMPDIPRQTWFGFPLAHRYTFTTPSLDSGVRIHVMDLKAIAAKGLTQTIQARCNRWVSGRTLASLSITLEGRQHFPPGHRKYISQTVILSLAHCAVRTISSYKM